MSNIIRVKKNNNFVVMNKTALNDRSLSWKAKGVMAFMLSKPDDWTFYLDELATNATDGKASFRSGFNELKDRGYVQRIKKRDENGKFEWETIVYEVPHTDFPQVDNPHVEKPHVENRTLLSNELTNNELTNNDEHIYALFEFWNEQKIIRHKRMNQKMKSSTNARLEDNEFEELKQAIKNYSDVLAGIEYYWTHKWTYEEFMKPNNVIRFLDEAEPKRNFLKSKIPGFQHEPDERFENLF
ncbi:replication protein [Virgibacillus oceani]